MRNLKKNKQKMYYSMPSGSTVDIYETDDEGNTIYTNINGVDIPVVAASKVVYDKPVEFYANISFNSGETRMAEYGLDPSNYSAVISADKGKLPFNEQTIIWHKTEPGIIDDKWADETTADYRIIAVKTSLNEERFILKKRAESGDEVKPPSA